jgi:chain length determinant protein EpsF
MSPIQFLHVLRARWRVAVSVVLCAVSVALLLGLVMPKRYTATAAVLVDLNSQDPMTAGAMGGMSSGLVSSYMTTQMDIAQSERVVLKVVRSLRLADDTAFKFKKTWLEETNGVGDLESWIATQLLERYDVKPTRESGVMRLEFTARDRDVAARVANAFMQAYIDTTLELRVEPARQYNNFFDERAARLREDLEAAQRKLAAYQRTKGIIVTGERLDVETQRLAELSSQLVALQGQAAESGSRERFASGQLERIPEVLNSPVVSGLSSELSRQQSRLSELMARLGDQHPQVIEQRASVAQLRSQIASESRRVAASLGIANSVNQDRLASLRAAIEAQRQRVLRLTSQNDEASVLQRDVQNAQRAYDAVLARSSQASLESQNKQTNVSVLKRATPPPEASSPLIMNFLLLALVLGLVLAPCAVLLREMLDKRLRTPSDIINGLQQPLLVVLPLRHAGSRPVAARMNALRTAKQLLIASK